MDNEALFQEYAVLSRRIKAGDSSAFAEMYQKSARLVYGTCYGILRNEEDASDAMQETYMTCYQKIGELTNDMMFLSWLKKIAASRSLNLYKKNHGDVSYDDTIGAEADVAGDDDLESLPDAMLLKESNREILRSIMKSSLTDVQYQTILLYYYSEIPIETIAELMQCPVGTVKTRLKYARIKIKAGVEMYEEKTGDKIKVAIAVPFLARFFEEEASRLTLPPIDPTALLVKAAETGASAGANAVTGTTASGAGQAAAGVYSGAAPGVTMGAASEAATMGFFSTVAGKAILFVLCFFLLIGGIFAVKSILGGKGDDEYNNRIGKLSRETSGYGTHDSDASEAPSEVESVTDVSTVPQSSVPASTPDASDAQPEDPDVVDFNEPGFVAVDDIPELDQLKKLVHYFVKEYDYENVEDEMVLKGILVGENHPNLPFEVYFPDYSYMNGLTDPKGLMPKDSCSRVNFSYLEWAEENILNISAEDRARINSDENLKVSAPDNFAPSGGYITDDGFVYYTSGDAGDTESNGVFAAHYDGEVYTIYTTLYSDFDPSNDPDFDPVEDGRWIRYTMKLKRIDGKLYWTILDCHFMEQHDPSVLEPDYDPAAKLDLPVEVTDQDREWAEAYFQTASSLTPESLVPNKNFLKGTETVQFNLIYVNDDRIPELVCSTEVAGYGTYSSIYTYCNGQVILLDDTARSYKAGTSYAPRRNVLCSGGAVSGVDMTVSLTYWHMSDAGDSIIKESVFKAQYDPNKFTSLNSAKTAGETYDSYRYFLHYRDADVKYVPMTQGDMDRLCIEHPEVTKIEISAELTLSDLKIILKVS